MQSIIIKNKDVRFEPGQGAHVVHGDGAPRPAGAAAPVGDGAPEPALERCEKSVRLLESDGRVHAVELSCACGEVTRIELEYAEPERVETTAPAETPAPAEKAS